MYFVFFCLLLIVSGSGAITSVGAGIFCLCYKTVVNGPTAICDFFYKKKTITYLVRTFQKFCVWLSTLFALLYRT